MVRLVFRRGINLAVSTKFRRFKSLVESTEPHGEINTTPLVDVMLVLLIIFLITIPVINSSMKVDLPDEKFTEKVSQDEIAVVSITENGDVFFNGTSLGNSTQYFEMLSNLLKTNKMTSIQIHGDSGVSFEKIELIIKQMRLLGIETITFVTRP
tara:strand:- start:3704 stop:4165 length:462 start_codon:yes stop_codon:yes gene_type:complete